VKHRELVERSSALSDRLRDGEAWAPMTREEAREMAALVEELVAQVSPERWDQFMGAVVDEASRRAGSLAPIDR
jgi:hypothetical protein